jgi:hypothetical protein
MWTYNYGRRSAESLSRGKGASIFYLDTSPRFVRFTLRSTCTQERITAARHLIEKRKEETAMKKLFLFGLFALAISVPVLVMSVSIYAQPPDTEISFHEGTVTQVDATYRSLSIKDNQGVESTWQAAEGVDLRTVKPGERVRLQTRDSWGMVLQVTKIPSGQ